MKSKKNIPLIAKKKEFSNLVHLILNKFPCNHIYHRKMILIHSENLARQRRVSINI